MVFVEHRGYGVQVKVLIRKVRNKAAGTIGELVFSSVAKISHLGVVAAMHMLGLILVTILDICR